MFIYHQKCGFDVQEGAASAAVPKRKQDTTRESDNNGGMQRMAEVGAAFASFWG